MKTVSRIALLMLALLPVLAQAANKRQAKGRDGQCRVALTGEDLYVSTYMDARHDVVYQFRKCMFNNLYTFYRVGAVDNTSTTLSDPRSPIQVLINATSSDNIGPFGINSCGWAGGNHSLKEGGTTRTAETLAWQVLADGRTLTSGDETTARKVVVRVTNRIYDSAASHTDASGAVVNDAPFCIEHMEYVIENASIRVNANHEFMPTEPRTVPRYYGMQSMFEGETGVVTPASTFATWKKPGDFDITKRNDPDCRLFIERRNNEAFQTAYLLNSGLGNHAFVADDEPIFICASYGKSYHSLMARHTVRPGDKTQWSGIYTWYVTPLVDTPELFCHEGMVEGRHAVYINCLGRVQPTTITLPKGCRKIKVYDKRGDIAIARPTKGQQITVISAGPAYAIVQYDLK